MQGAANKWNMLSEVEKLWYTGKAKQEKKTLTIAMAQSGLYNARKTTNILKELQNEADPQPPEPNVQHVTPDTFVPMTGAPDVGEKTNIMMSDMAKAVTTHVTFGDYTFEASASTMLGRGTFGCVHVGYSKNLAKLVAVKTFFDRKERDIEETNWRKLGNAVEKSNSDVRFHHHFPERFGASAPPSSIYCVAMQYFTTDLNCFLRSKEGLTTLTEHVAASMILQVEQALKIMHNVAGMLHLDIKPGNILLQPHTWNTVLTDLGLSQEIGERPRIRTVVTHLYRPPEVFASGDLTQLPDKFLKVVMTPAIDVFSFGCVVWEVMNKVFHKKPDSYDMLFNIREMQLDTSYIEWSKGKLNSLKVRLLQAYHWYPLVESMVGAASKRVLVWPRFREEVPISISLAHLHKKKQCCIAKNVGATTARLR